MSGFFSALITRTLSASECKAARSGVGLFQLTEDFIYASDLLGCIVTVPAGFVTDYASIPRAALWWVNGDDPCIAFASVIHDFLYSLRGSLPNRSKVVTREEADGVLREAMALCGARADQRAIVFQAVRLFGDQHWHA